MKKITIQDSHKPALVDDHDYERLLAKGPWSLRNSKAYSPSSVPPYMHHEVLNHSSSLHVHHIDGNRLNNQKANLTLLTRGQNIQAHKALKKSRPFVWKTPAPMREYLGTKFTPHVDLPWSAALEYGGRVFRPGKRFLEEIQAALAYDSLVVSVLGSEAELNFPDLVLLDEEKRSRP